RRLTTVVPIVNSSGVGSAKRNAPRSGTSPKGGKAMTRGQRQLGVLAILTAAVLAAAVTAGATRTAFPGKNGRIVFNDKTGALVLVNPDGTGLVRLARTQVADELIGASWSPDGKQIAYSRYGNGDADIYTIEPDGSNQRE